MTYFDESLDIYIKTVLGRKPLAPVVLDVHGLTSIADYFIILSGKSNRQVIALSDFIKSELKRYEIKPLAVEGTKDGHWHLLDYGHIIIHIFYEPVRDFYDLEGLWSDAKRIQLSGIMAKAF
mmetsp:Transcript_2815/g.1655  ORF Transcript_2815/g.1655 Transcript_2815/m.1655 type:complete len:122 (+) Transcript_2815:61-426(+)